MQYSQPLSFIKKHRIENDLEQFGELKALSSFLDHNKLITWEQSLKIVRERQRGKSNPTLISFEVVGNILSHLAGA